MPKTMNEIKAPQWNRRHPFATKLVPIPVLTKRLYSQTQTTTTRTISRLRKANVKPKNFKKKLWLKTQWVQRLQQTTLYEPSALFMRVPLFLISSIIVWKSLKGHSTLSATRRKSSKVQLAPRPIILHTSL